MFDPPFVAHVLTFAAGSYFGGMSALHLCGFGRRYHAEQRDAAQAAALREAEEKYRHIFDNAVEGLYQTTRDGHFLSANRALARICGYDTPAELIESQGDNRRYHYVDPERHAEFQLLMQQQGVVLGFESEIYRRDGSTVWISECARAVCNAVGKLEYYEGSVVEIPGNKPGTPRS